jgi:predicted RNA-binding protein YlxR (DUF448 family)
MADGKKTPFRRCAGCGQMIEKPGLIRVVKDTDGVFVDLTSKKNGRGAYVCRNMECISMAEKKRGIERSLKGTVPTEVYEALKLATNETGGLL